jgi:hypothetical protein
MLLYVRDWEKRIGDFSMAMIAYIEMYVDEDGFLETERLSEPLLTFYKELRKGGKPLRQWTEELREAAGILENSRSEAETTPLSPLRTIEQARPDEIKVLDKWLR